MKVVLISTVFNEGEDLLAWAAALRQQTRPPDEFVIVDGGSTDGTPERLRQAFAGGGFPAPKIIGEKCNIARGRNLAIKNSTAEIIVSIDGGSLAEPTWLEKLVAPFFARPEIQIVGGWSRLQVTTPFGQRMRGFIEMPRDAFVAGGPCHTSSRNIAFLRSAWQTVGGYPEWLTLAGEDLLFNCNLEIADVRSCYEPAAVVSWDGRPDLKSYLRLFYRNSYALGELRLIYPYYFNWLLTTVIPPLILFSKHPLGDVRFRFLRNAYGVGGWLAGRFGGHKPPPGWKKVQGQWLSPETLAYLGGRRPASVRAETKK